MPTILLHLFQINRPTFLKASMKFELIRSFSDVSSVFRGSSIGNSFLQDCWIIVGFIPSKCYLFSYNFHTYNFDELHKIWVAQWVEWAEQLPSKSNVIRPQVPHPSITKLSNLVCTTGMESILSASPEAKHTTYRDIQLPLLSKPNARNLRAPRRAIHTRRLSPFWLLLSWTPLLSSSSWTLPTFVLLPLTLQCRTSSL